jgi:hypothetical protein
VTISNSELLSSRETGVNFGTSKKKGTDTIELDVGKLLVVSISHN